MTRNVNTLAIDWLYSMKPNVTLIWIGAVLLLIMGIKRYKQHSSGVTMKITRIFVHPIKVSCPLYGTYWIDPFVELSRDICKYK